MRTLKARYDRKRDRISAELRQLVASRLCLIRASTGVYCEDFEYQSLSRQLELIESEIEEKEEFLAKMSPKEKFLSRQIAAFDARRGQPVNESELAEAAEFAMLVESRVKLYDSLTDLRKRLFSRLNEKKRDKVAVAQRDRNSAVMRVGRLWLALLQQETAIRITASWAEHRRLKSESHILHFRLVKAQEDYSHLLSEYDGVYKGIKQYEDPMQYCKWWTTHHPKYAAIVCSC